MNWMIQSSGTGAQLSALDVLDEENVFASGGSRIFVKTSNGGVTWDVTAINSCHCSICIHDRHYWTDVNFIDQKTGFIVGSNHDLFFGSSVSFILKTIDGGMSWACNQYSGSNYYTDIHFINHSTGWIGGSYQLMKTTNTGSTWQGQENLPNFMHDIYFINETTGWFAGKSGAIMKTTSGGKSFLTSRLKVKAEVEGFYDQTSNSSAEDTIKFYIRRSVPPYEAVDSGRIFLDSNGEGAEFVNNVSQAVGYYIQISGRNSIDVWSSEPVSFTIFQTEYDFTSSQNRAYGNNLKQVDTDPIVFAMFSGDVNNDGLIDGTDMQMVENDAGSFLSGYVPTDLNGDYFVDGSDYVIVDENAGRMISVLSP